MARKIRNPKSDPLRQAQSAARTNSNQEISTEQNAGPSLFKLKTEIQTTKHTKHTKTELLIKRTLFTRSVSISVAADPVYFVYFVYFVVSTAFFKFKLSSALFCR